MCEVCQLHWCYVSSEKHNDDSMLDCQISTKKAVYYTCKYKNVSIPSTLYIGAKGVASTSKTLSSPMPSPEKENSLSASKKGTSTGGIKLTNKLCC